MTLVNCWTLLTYVPKSSILDVVRFLDSLLNFDFKDFIAHSRDTKTAIMLVSEHIITFGIVLWYPFLARVVSKISQLWKFFEAIFTVHLQILQFRTRKTWYILRISLLKNVQLLSIVGNSSVLNLSGFLDLAQLFQLFIVLLV